MDQNILVPLKATLEQRRSELSSFSERTGNQGRHLSAEDPQDAGDRSVFSSEREFLFQQSSQCLLTLHMIDAALQRIQQGTFGECQMCGDKIELKRLKALPWTHYCLACQETIEPDRCELGAA